MSGGLLRIALGARFGLSGPASSKRGKPDCGGKGFFLAGKGQYIHEVVGLDPQHSALVCTRPERHGDGAGAEIVGRDFLARLAEGRPDMWSRNRIAVHIAGDCIGYLPPSLSTIYAEWAQDWHLTNTLILCRARVLTMPPLGYGARAGVRGRPLGRVLVDIARPFQIRAFGS